MKCPNCRCEVGNQPVCPYCGATVYLQAAPSWNNSDYSRHGVQSADARSQKRRVVELKDVDRRIRNLETKVNLCLVLLCGNFALMILTIIILALR